MKKLTAGIFSAVLGLVAIGGAQADIATGAYVETVVNREVKVVDDRAKENATNITALQGTVGDENSGLVKQANASTAAITLLNADDTEEGSVAYQIKEANGELEKGITANKTAIEAMDLTADGQSGVIKQVTQADGKVSVQSGPIANDDIAGDAAIDQSKIAGLSSALDGKQDVLVAGSDNVTFGENEDGKPTISVAEYELPEATAEVLGGVKAGDNVAIAGGVISVAGANASTAGVTKLYTGTGEGADGTMTQAAITTALENKLPMPPADAVNSDGMYVLTWNGANGYAWEAIDGRGSAEGGDQVSD